MGGERGEATNPNQPPPPGLHARSESYARPGRSVFSFPVDVAAAGFEDPKCLVEDARRGIRSSQEADLQRAYSQLLSLKKIHDQLKVYRESLERRYTRAVKVLEAVKDDIEADTALSVCSEETKLKKRLQEEERGVLDSLIERERWLLMSHRLRESIFELKKQSQVLNRGVKSLERERANCESQYQQNKQELRTAEDQLKVLQEELEKRKQERQKSMDMLNRLVDERGQLLEQSMEGLRRRDELLAIHSGEIPSEEHNKLARMSVVRNVYSSVLQRKLEQNHAILGDMEDVFQQIKSATGLSNVEDIIDRFSSKSVKNQELHQIAEESRQRIEQLRKDNVVRMHALIEQRNLVEANSSKRESYQEVDLIDVALENARRQCEESIARSNRISVTIDALRNAVARFLTKVDCKTHETAPNEKLAENFALLDTKITQMMKAVNAALVKDKDGRESSSKNPGLDLSNINKTLYHNLMSAEPDKSLRNVRVTPRNDEDEKMMRRKKLLGAAYCAREEEDNTPSNPLSPQGDSGDCSSEEGEWQQHDHKAHSPSSNPHLDSFSLDHPSPFVDRGTVKKLSKLITSRHEKAAAAAAALRKRGYHHALRTKRRLKNP